MNEYEIATDDKHISEKMITNTRINSGINMIRVKIGKKIKYKCE